MTLETSIPPSIEPLFNWSLEFFKLSNDCCQKSSLQGDTNIVVESFVEWGIVTIKKVDKTKCLLFKDAKIDNENNYCSSNKLNNGCLLELSLILHADSLLPLFRNSLREKPSD